MEKKFKCEECDKAFPARAKLKDHVIIIHRKIKRFECHICGEKAFTKHGIKKHIERHGKGEVFKCEHCDFETDMRNQKYKHIASAHKKVD